MNRYFLYMKNLIIILLLEDFGTKIHSEFSLLYLITFWYCLRLIFLLKSFIALM